MFNVFTAVMIARFTIMFADNILRWLTSLCRQACKTCLSVAGSFRRPSRKGWQLSSCTFKDNVPESGPDGGFRG